MRLVALLTLLALAAGTASADVVNGTFDNNTNFVPASSFTAGPTTVGQWHQGNSWVQAATGGNPGGVISYSGATGDGAILQAIAMPAGSFTVSFDRMNDTAMWVDVIGLDSGGTVNLNAWSNPPNKLLPDEVQLNPSGIWVHESFNVTGTAFQYVVVELWKYDGNGKVDNVVVTPEPATMALLGLGGLGLLRRRRA